MELFLTVPGMFSMWRVVELSLNPASVHAISRALRDVGLAVRIAKMRWLLEVADW
jgi:hypothetical protein